METPLTILYTANLRGQIDLLPRLHTFMRHLRTQRVEDEDEVMLCALEPPQRRFLLLDLGESCSPEVWHCAVTGGRSMLIVLDAMGYHAANVSNMLTEEGRARLEANLLNIALVDPETGWQQENIRVTCGEKRPHSAYGGGSEGEARLKVILTPAAETRLDQRTLRLAAVQAGQVGVVHLNTLAAITAHDVLTLPLGTPPDPTITATADFVLSEARLFQRKRES